MSSGTTLCRCAHCLVSFSSKCELTVHLLEKHLEGTRFHCQACGYTVLSKGTLRAHWRRKHQGRLVCSVSPAPLSCALCPRTFRSVAVLERHVESRHAQFLTCGLCDTLALAVHHLMHHYRLQHGEEAWLQHQTEVHCALTPRFRSLKPEPSSSRYRCFVCSMCIKSRTRLAVHVLTQHFLVHCYRCRYCNFEGRSLSVVQQHMRSQHPRKPPRGDCLKPGLAGTGIKCVGFRTPHQTFGNVLTYRMHLHIHRQHGKERGGEIRFEDDRCSYKGQSTILLLKHFMLKHREMLECDICKNMQEVPEEGNKLLNYCLEDLASLEQFLMDPASCARFLQDAAACERLVSAWLVEVCTAELTRINSLRPIGGRYRCNYCDGIYSNLYSLRNHVVWIHLGLARFKCELCQVTYSNAGNFKLHFQNKHPGETIRWVDTIPLPENLKSLFKKETSSIPVRTDHLSKKKARLQCQEYSKKIKPIEFVDVARQVKSEFPEKQQDNEKEGCFKCQTCQTEFSQQEEHRKHVLHCSLSLFKCSICTFSYRTGQEMRSHMASHRRNVLPLNIDTLGAQQQAIDTCLIKARRPPAVQGMRKPIASERVIVQTAIFYPEEMFSAEVAPSDSNFYQCSRCSMVLQGKTQYCNHLTCCGLATIRSSLTHVPDPVWVAPGPGPLDIPPQLSEPMDKTLLVKSEPGIPVLAEQLSIKQENVEELPTERQNLFCIKKEPIT